MKISISMRRFNIAYTIGGVALAALSLTSCISRTENLDNLNVITKPYSLHFADIHGTIYSTYDGLRFDVIPNAQGVSMEGLATTDKYLLMRPNAFTLFVDDAGEGKNHNFNLTYDAVNPASFGPTFILNIPNYSDTGKAVLDRVYLASNKFGGLAYNDSNAQTKSSWFHEGDTALGGSVTSLAQLDSKAIIAFDDASRRVWIKENVKSLWKSQTASGLPTGGRMFIIKQKETIFAVMTENATDFGIWRSDNQGHTFSKLPDGLPADVTCAVVPFDKVLVVGTASSGIWRLSGQGNWERSGVGLKSGIHIYGLTYKSNKFKNEKSGEYVFAATNDGVYRSDDLGQNWVKLDIPPTVKDINLIH